MVIKKPAIALDSLDVSDSVPSPVPRRVTTFTAKNTFDGIKYLSNDELGNVIYNDSLPTATISGQLIAIRDEQGIGLYCSVYTPSLDQYAASVSLLLNFNGLIGSTTDFVDSSPNNFSVSPNSLSDSFYAAKIDGQAKFGIGCLITSSTASRHLLTQPSSEFSLGTQDFTWECWIRPSSVSESRRYIMTNDGYPATANGMALAYNGSDLEAWYSTGGSATNLITATSCLSALTWQHVAWSRSGGVNRLFVNGSQVGANATNSTNFNATRVHIGGYSVYGGSGNFNGRTDDYRLTKGVARYTGSFSVPTSEFTALPTYNWKRCTGSLPRFNPISGQTYDPNYPFYGNSVF
jgi:hypothetical protein